MSNRVFLVFAALLLAGSVSAETVTFDDLSLAPNSVFAGPTANAVTVPGPFGPSQDGTFTSGGVQFSNHYDVTYGISSGFFYSNMTDTTTPDYTNPYSAYTGTGAGPGEDNYGVAFGYHDLTANNYEPAPFDPTDPAQLYQLPNFQLPAGYKIDSMEVTNTTYAALSMLDDNSFSKKFGGPTGKDPDWFKLTAYGTDANNHLLAPTVNFYLADFRFDDNSLDYVLNTWATMDLSALSAATHLYFNLSSSDVGDNGMNTPGYFAVDNIQISPVPEPSSFVLMLAAAVGAFVMRRNRRS